MAPAACFYITAEAEAAFVPSDFVLEERDFIVQQFNVFGQCAWGLHNEIINIPKKTKLEEKGDDCDRLGGLLKREGSCSSTTDMGRREISLRLGMWELGGVWGLHDNASNALFAGMWWWRSDGQTRPQGGHMARTTGGLWCFTSENGDGWGPTSGDVWLVVVMGGGRVLELLGMRALHPPPRWM
ncbi:hypothetical protein L3X38_034829 [Prunus dulcis]|uniref:Uncharacterized protein n=1 Tax=Prunus dulcis TaxID=3755 RepID=A0AAD4VIJ2_PRUDU|nr:hypothetical protein L3X38_034829 [Prunus dulcis]